MIEIIIKTLSLIMSLSVVLTFASVIYFITDTALLVKWHVIEII